MDAEQNRNKRRDKKRRTRMIVDDSARKLAGYRASRYGKFIYITNELLQEEPETELQRQQRISGQ